MHVMQCYPAIKKSKLLIHATGGKSQKYFILNEINQT